MTQSLNQSIAFRIQELAAEKECRMIECENLILEIEQTAADRIDSLPRLRKAHENEASVLVSHTNQLKAHYAAVVANVLAKNTAFLKEVKLVESKLHDLKTSESLILLRKDFDLKSRTHGSEIKNTLAELVKYFDQTKRTIFKSREPGHHAAAWQIIDESDVLGRDSLNVELEKYRDTLDAQVQGSFNESKQQLNLLALEFDYYIQDSELVESCTRYYSRMRVSLKAEQASNKKKITALETNLAQLDASLPETHTWVILVNVGRLSPIDSKTRRV